MLKFMRAYMRAGCRSSESKSGMMGWVLQGEVAVVTARSAALLFSPAAPQQLLGLAECRPQALVLRARRGLTLRGRLLPPVEDVQLTLSSGQCLCNFLVAPVTDNLITFTTLSIIATRYYCNYQLFSNFGDHFFSNNCLSFLANIHLLSIISVKKNTNHY